MFDWAWDIEPPPRDADLTRKQCAALAIIEDCIRSAESTAEGYEYFASKFAAAGWGLSWHDLPMLSYLRERGDRRCKIWEIGAGAGQLGALLALDGFHVVSLEQYPGRFAIMPTALAQLSGHWPEIRTRWQPMRGFFPSDFVGQDFSQDIALVLEVAFAHGHAAFFAEIAKFHTVIIDFDTFPDTTSGDRASAFAEEYGFSSPTPLFHLTEAGYRGHVFRIER